MKQINRPSNSCVAPFINGKLVHSESTATISAINPSNGKLLMVFAAGSEMDVNRAVAASRNALIDARWSDMPPSSRKRILHRFADLIADEAQTLNNMDAEEMGKPVSTSAFDAASAAELVHFNAEIVDKVLGDVYSSDRQSLVVQRRVPRGVVAAVIPWNFPTFNAALKLAPALAGGNCVVLKPSELSSRSALRLAELALQAGLPEGVFNVVPGLGQIVGSALGLHNDVDMVAFTGSTEVGRLMLQYSGRSNMKLVQAETGGKSPQVVFDDGVNVDAASEMIAGFLLTNQGQVCSVGSRLLVQRSIEDEMIEKIALKMKQVTMGDAMDPNTTFGPLVSGKQCERVMSYIDGAQAEGAQLVVGGGRSLRESGGYFVEPTIFRNVSLSSRLAQEEVFGPVLSVFPFDDEAEAIRIANSTAYGLAAYVWTSSLSTGIRMAKSIRSTVLVNAAAPNGEGPGHAASWDPAGQSGVGTEGGAAGMEVYMRRQLVWFNHA